MTFPERLLWSRLRGKQLDGIRFRRQAPVGSFIVDFLCDEHRLAIELDGRSHEASAEYDAERGRLLAREGYHVVRYENDEILANIEAVLRDIARRCGRDVQWW